MTFYANIKMPTIIIDNTLGYRRTELIIKFGHHIFKNCPLLKRCIKKKIHRTLKMKLLAAQIMSIKEIMHTQIVSFFYNDQQNDCVLSLGQHKA